MPERRVCFAVNVYGEPRHLLSVRERSNGDLVLGMRPGLTHGLDGDRPRIKHQKFSVHASEKSPKFTTITARTVLSDRRIHEYYHLTDAVKAKTGFAPVFLKVAPTLANARYSVAQETSTEILRVGSYSPFKSSLFYGVYVSHADVSLDRALLDRMTMTDCKFTQFRLTVLPVVFPLPSIAVGTLANYATQPPEDAVSDADRAKRERLMKGLSGGQCLHNFKEIAYGHSAKQLTLVMEHLKSLPQDDPRKIIALAGGRRLLPFLKAYLDANPE